MAVPNGGSGDAGAFRAIGRAELDEGGMRASFDLALSASGGRARLDLAMPTGMAAVVLWIDGPRWILVDMLGREVWSGSVAELARALPAMAPPVQAALLLPAAAGTLIGGGAFDTIFPWQSSAVTAPPGAAGVAAPVMDWSVSFNAARLPWSGAGRLDWPDRWSVSRPGTSLEVMWSQLAPLDADGRRGLQPRVPAGLPLRSLPSLLP